MEAQVTVQTIETSILVLLGSLFFPLLPLLGALSNLVTFYTKILLASYVLEPPRTRTSASRTSIMAYSLVAGACHSARHAK